jgi:hypothetical protein
MTKQLSDKAKAFLARKPTFIGTVNGIDYYEHPIYGDENPLVLIDRDGKVRDSAHWELPVEE